MNYCFCNMVGFEATSYEDVVISSFLLPVVWSTISSETLVIKLDWIETATLEMSYSCPIFLPPPSSYVCILSFLAAVSSINLLVKLKDVSKPDTFGRLCPASLLGRELLLIKTCVIDYETANLVFSPVDWADVSDGVSYWAVEDALWMARADELVV